MPIIQRKSSRSVVTSGSRAYKQRRDVQLAEEKAERYAEAVAELEEELKEEIAELEEKFDPDKTELERISIQPYKKDIDVETVALLWLPHDERGEKVW